MKKIIRHINFYFSTIKYLQSIRYIGFLFLFTNALQAQDVQTELENAAKVLYNPIYAILEIPNENGTVSTIDILKSDIHTIQKLENYFQFIENKTINIDDKLFYIETNTKTHQRTFKVYKATDVKTESSEKIAKAASTKIEVVPATYETVTEAVLSKTLPEKLITIPAEYETITETILIRPAITKKIPCNSTLQYQITDMKKMSNDTIRWIKRKPSKPTCCLTNSNEDCQVWYLVEVPARYEMTIDTIIQPCEKEIIVQPAVYDTLTKTFLKTPAYTKRVVVPNQRRKITRKVVKEPAYTRTIETPAEYITTYNNIIAKEARPYSFEIPVQYNTITTQGRQSAPTYKTVEVPPVYKTITMQTLVKSADGQSAQCKTINKRVMVRPAESKIVEIPSSCNETQTKSIPIRGEHLDTLIPTRINTTDQIKIYRPKNNDDLKKSIEKTTNIKIFPNPTNRILNIQTTENILNIEVMNLKGSTLISKAYDMRQRIQLPVSNLSDGVYILLIKTENDFITSKFIISNE